MRRVNYKVRRGNETFVTTSYAEATADGVRIIETFLTEVDERTEKENTQEQECVKLRKGRNLKKN